MKEVYSFLDNYLCENDTVVCATSGGVDSMVLLHVLINYNKKLNIVCAHINHNLREESFEEYDFVKEYCNKNHIKFEGLVLEKDIKGNLESEFRERRYNFFDEIVNKYNAKYLFTAHHGDDLIETILMRLVRGSTIEGYSGFNKIVEKEKYSILRPLVYMTKEEIYEYATNNNIEYREDATNNSDKYTRNRYRKYILPKLKEENQNVHRKFLEYSEELNKSYDFIYNYINNIFNERYNSSSFDLSEINKLNDFVLEKLLIELFKKEYKNDVNLINKSHLSEVIKIIKSDKPNLTIDLPLDKVAVKNYNTLRIGDKNIINDYNIEISDKDIKVPKGIIKKIDKTGLTSNFVCHLDSNEVKLPLYVRNRKDGDYIEVLGMNGKKKIKDIFIDSKIKKEDRDSYPIVVDSDDKVLWIPGIKKSKYNSLKTGKYDIILWYMKEDNDE